MIGRGAAAPRISIGLPVFNGGRFLAASIESLLGQTFSDFELIVSDNGSVDETEEICRAYAARDGRIRYHRAPENMGAAWNYNRVFELATGEYFKWASHDDLHLPRFVEECLAVLERDPAVALAFTRTDFIDDHGLVTRRYVYGLKTGSGDVRERFWDTIRSNHIVYETFGLSRRRTMLQTPLIGNYAASDRVYLATLALHGRFHEIPEVLFLHREHAERSMRAFTSSEERQRWFDPRRTGRVVLPHWRQLYESVRVAAGGPVPLPLRARLIGDVAYLAAKRRRDLGSELGAALRHVVGRFVRPAEGL